MPGPGPAPVVTPQEPLSQEPVVDVAVDVEGGLLVPVPYRIRCDARLQPATLRYVTAPYESLLEAILVEPGENAFVRKPAGVRTPDDRS